MPRTKYARRISVQQILFLQAKPRPLCEGSEYHSVKDFGFLKWAGESGWTEWEGQARDFDKLLRQGVCVEIQVQPLMMSEATRTSIEELYDSGANGTTLYRQFWQKGNVQWVPDPQRRMTWTFDPENDYKLYTTFEKGQWVEPNDNDDPGTTLEFSNPHPTQDFSGRCLSGLPLAMQGRRRTGHGLPTNLDFAALENSKLDGLQSMSSLRGAHLHKAHVYGESTLQQSDLTGANLWGAHFEFQHVCVVSDVFQHACLSKTAFLQSVTLEFGDKDQPTDTPDEIAEMVRYGISACCGGGCCGSSRRSQGPTRSRRHYRCNLGCGSIVWGVRTYLFYVCHALRTPREVLLTHQHELQSLMDELERLRAYDINKDNWHELVDSWIALKGIRLETYAAAQLRYDLFDEPTVRPYSKQLFVTGKVLYSTNDNEAPSGLLFQLKTLLGENLLRNKDYKHKVVDLTDELANLQVILRWQDQLLTVFQNLVLAIFFFVANLGSTYVSSLLGLDFWNADGGDNNNNNNSVLGV